MIVVGITHFVKPEPFVRIVPPQLPYPLELVYISGFWLFWVSGEVRIMEYS